MASKWAGIHDRISDRVRIFTPRSYYGQYNERARPAGATSGDWIPLGLGAVWVRLGHRSSWADEDLDDQVITQVNP